MKARTRILDALKDNIEVLDDIYAGNMRGVDYPLGRRPDWKQNKIPKTMNFSREQEKEIHGQIEQLRRLKLIEKAPIREDNVISAIFLVKKKDENGQYTKWRLVQNFKPVNEGLIANPLIMPDMEQELNRLRDARYFSILDLKSAFWQIPLREEDRPFTCFRVPGKGLYRWTVWPMGVKTAPACCVQMTRDILKGMEDYSAPYTDDLIVFSRNALDHALHVTNVLTALKKQKRC